MSVKVSRIEEGTECVKETNTNGKRKGRHNNEVKTNIK
jgi:hypothetical protein